MRDALDVGTSRAELWLAADDGACAVVVFAGVPQPPAVRQAPIKITISHADRIDQTVPTGVARGCPSRTASHRHGTGWNAATGDATRRRCPVNVPIRRRVGRWALLLAAAASAGAVAVPAYAATTSTRPQTVVIPGKGDDGPGP